MTFSFSPASFGAAALAARPHVAVLAGVCMLTMSGCVVPVPQPPQTTDTVNSYTDDSDSTSGEPTGAAAGGYGDTSDEPTRSKTTTTSSTNDIVEFSGIDSDIINKLFIECIPAAVAATTPRTELAPCAKGEALEILETLVESVDDQELLTYYSGEVVDRNYLVHKTVDKKTDEWTMEVFVELCVNTHQGEAYHTYRVVDLGEPSAVIDDFGPDWGWDCSPLRD